MTAYNQGDPRQKIQICDICNCPTGNCEDDSIYRIDCNEDRYGGLICRECFDELNKDTKAI